MANHLALLCLVCILHLSGVKPDVLDVKPTDASSGLEKQILFSRRLMEQVLCQITETYSAHDVISSQLLQRRYMTEGNDTDLSPLKETIQLGRLDLIECCKNDSEEYINHCINHVRKRRIDEVCSKDVTRRLPVTIYRRDFMSERIANCCYEIGSQRYECFDEGARNTTSEDRLEYSLDETDPINDIWNYRINLTVLNLALTSSSPKEARKLINRLAALGGERPRQSRHLQEGEVKETTTSSNLMSVLKSDQTMSKNGTNLNGTQMRTGRAPPKNETKVRHPGAILESFRRLASNKRSRANLSESTLSNMTRQEIQDLVSSLQQQWWVFRPETLRKSLVSFGYNPDVLNSMLPDAREDAKSKENADAGNLSPSFTTLKRSSSHSDKLNPRGVTFTNESSSANETPSFIALMKNSTDNESETSMASNNTDELAPSSLLMNMNITDAQNLNTTSVAFKNGTDSPELTSLEPEDLTARNGTDESKRRSVHGKRRVENESLGKGGNCTYSLLDYDQLQGQTLPDILRRKFKHDNFGLK